MEKSPCELFSNRLMILGEESAILDGEVEDLKKVLQFVDIDTRQRVLHEVRTVKHRYREMLLKAQHDKDNADKVKNPLTNVFDV